MRILFLLSSEFPDHSANATRIVNLAKLMRECGNDCTLLGIRYGDNTTESGECDGILYSHIDALSYNSVPKSKRTSFIKKVVSKALEREYKKQPFDLIVISDFAVQSIGFIIKFAKKNRVKLAYNSVEWYESDNPVFSGLNGKIKLIKNRYQMIFEQKRLGNIIAISSYLQNYYDRKKCNTVRIPTIVDKDRYGFVPQTNNDKTIIAYAGSPGKKDYICNAIEALTLLTNEERQKIQLHLYGVKPEQLIKMGVSKEKAETLDGVLFAHGRIPFSEVQDKISSADFTILLRPNLRYANAGFPTKVGESMMCATPVIANHTSDLALYIRDNDTGIVVENETAEACAAGLRRAVKMSCEEKTAMRENARKEAEKSFNFGVYQKEINEFLEELKEI